MSTLIEQAAARLAQLRNSGLAPAPADAGVEAAVPPPQRDALPVPPAELPALPFQPGVPPDFRAELPPAYVPPLPPELSPELPPPFQPELPPPFQPQPSAPFASSYGPELHPSEPRPPLSAGFPYEAPSQAGAGFQPDYGYQPPMYGHGMGMAAPPRSMAATSRRVELDLQRLAAANFVTPGAPRSRIADQYRVIKRPLIANALGKGAAPVAHGNRIMVTSALPGEGKTFTAVNLALSIAAELDTTVMLVDADVGRPSVLKTLGLAPGPGLLDVLEGRATMPEVLLRTNIDKLTLLSAGTLHDRATEVLASDGMQSLLQEVAQRYDDRIIIFDSPPLLLTTEARALASHMGQIVMVVRAGHTSQSDVQAALGTIEFCPVKLLVLNQARSSKFDTYSTGYKYGYGYGYGQEQAQQQPG
ncbi:XrtA-associated tyrosine autokinase [Azohydromonas australica]|uniref:XrtA-associated tyrosine autokinase n=1 Tax=Azohydromonas australica TaxID=364039 RepID=UPI000418B5FA|nr:XrtA-associated tyrosine autokinase [Azohydromonas australica]